MRNRAQLRRARAGVGTNTTRVGHAATSRLAVRWKAFSRRMRFACTVVWAAGQIEPNPACVGPYADRALQPAGARAGAVLRWSASSSSS